MTRINNGLLRNWNCVIAWFLSICGVATSCIRAEYGTPEAKFIVDGTVVSEETLDPVPGIRVIMGWDTAFTGPSGSYRVTTVDFPDPQAFNIGFQDVDGPANGEFDPHDTLIRFENPEFRNGSGSWYAGEVEQQVNVKLKPGR
ncbi:MAG: radical SAM-associated putative lipoprotein [Bacteroidales bacterium]